MAKWSRNKYELEIGSVHGKWTILGGPTDEAPSHRKYWCQCSCGKLQWVIGRSICNSKSLSCMSCRYNGYPAIYEQLNISRKLYLRLKGSVNGSIDRCTNSLNRAYCYYGARGISVYPPWIENRRQFLEYLLTLPGHDDPDLYMDRANNDGNYEPGNLRFVTVSISNTNKRY